jgi:hypothetical protein
MQKMQENYNGMWKDRKGNISDLIEKLCGFNVRLLIAAANNIINGYLVVMCFWQKCIKWN